MLNTGEKYLKFRSGPYNLLIAIPYVIEIADLSKDRREIPAGSTTTDERPFYEQTLHEKIIRWNDMDLPRINMRSALEVEGKTTNEPLHVLVLRGTTADDAPFALVTVDEVDHIMEIEENQWYALNGINPRLDIFFDRICLDKTDGKILMRLAPVEQWATSNTGASNDY
jgi:hypothetical protein